jgi:hypothetical protein
MNRCKSVIEIGRRRFLTGAGVAAAGWLALVAARSSRCLAKRARKPIHRPLTH